jgi:hypothetical protein
MSINIDEFRNKMYKSPRLNELFESFEKIANGIDQVPYKIPKIDKSYLNKDDYLFHDYIFNKNLSTFFKHGISSIPYLSEEILRVDVAIKKLAEEEGIKRESPLTYWETSSADGSRARTLAEYSNGLVVTLTDSPNIGNKVQFDLSPFHPYSYFYHGVFVDICPEFLVKQTYHDAFKNKFDIIWENTTFQMYGNNRLEQLTFLNQSLKEDGLIILLEKMNAKNSDEYNLMEIYKDDFKSKFFDKNQIAKKKETILNTMEDGQVTKEELSNAASKVFKYGYIIWNSTNFYEFVFSNSKSRIEKFISYLPDAYVPQELIIEDSMVNTLW